MNLSSSDLIKLWMYRELLTIELNSLIFIEDLKNKWTTVCIDPAILNPNLIRLEWINRSIQELPFRSMLMEDTIKVYKKFENLKTYFISKIKDENAKRTTDWGKDA